MSELISGKEALIAVLNGEGVEMSDSEVEMDWTKINSDGSLGDDQNSSPCLGLFLRELKHINFRLKPRTITLNGVDVDSRTQITICGTSKTMEIAFSNMDDLNFLHNSLFKSNK